ncbi:MAG: transcription antitermination factor NusB [Halothiobacillaceae bacterium]|nr:transcription antitermination factor NusB [Halothiobacillaceae bacterium]
MITQFPQDESSVPDEPEGGGATGHHPSGGKAVPARKQRRWARERAVQGLYQQMMNPIPVDQLESQFMEDAFMLRLDLALFRGILRGVGQHAAELDAAIEPHLDRPISELDPIEHAILQLGAFELMHMLETPRAIVINESVELAKRFGATEGHRYVNGVLDRLADQVRAGEPRRRD